MTKGLLSFSSNLTLSSAGTIGFPLAGLTSGTEFGRLEVQGNLTLTGTIAITRVNGFNPPPGAEFPVIAITGTRNGFFQTFTGNEQALTGIFFLNPSYRTKGVSIVVLAATPLLTDLSREVPGHFHVNGIVGQVYRLEASIDLVDWVELLTGAVPGSAFIDYADPEAAVLRYRFYGVKFKP